jgi:hypothetical protein
MKAQRITASDVNGIFDKLCYSLRVTNAEYKNVVGDYMLITNQSPAGTESDRRYYIHGEIAGTTVNKVLIGSRNAYETLSMMLWASDMAKRLL